MITITVDANSPAWSPDEETTRYFLNQQIVYLKMLMLHRNYLYLDRIYECFGVAWNPDWDNVCYKVVDGVLHMEAQQGLGDVWFIEITR